MEECTKHLDNVGTSDSGSWRPRTFRIETEKFHCVTSLCVCVWTHSHWCSWQISVCPCWTSITFPSEALLVISRGSPGCWYSPWAHKWICSFVLAPLSGALTLCGMTEPSVRINPTKHIGRLPGWLSGKESACNARDAGGTGSISGLARSPREGHDNPLQYSCLENPMDRVTWQATVLRVTNSCRQLRRLSMHARKYLGVFTSWEAGAALLCGRVGQGEDGKRDSVCWALKQHVYLDFFFFKDLLQLLA